jgi:hypothetical protein
MSGCVLLPDPASGNWSSVVGTLSLPYLIVPSPGTLEEVVYYAAWVGLDGDTATNSAVFNGQTPGFTVYPVWWVPIPGVTASQNLYGGNVANAPAMNSEPPKFPPS